MIQNLTKVINQFNRKILTIWHKMTGQMEQLTMIK